MTKKISPKSQRERELRYRYKDCSDLMGLSLDEVIDSLQGLRTMINEEGGEQARIDVDSEDEYTTHILVKYLSLENDKEYNDRMKLLDRIQSVKKEAKKERLDNDRKQYERLKKKFEKNGTRK